MKLSKRILSLLLACMTILSVVVVIPATVSAEVIPDGFIAPEDNSIPLQTETTAAQTSPDGFFIDGVMQNNQAGGEAAHTWLSAKGYQIEDKNTSYSTIAFYGWTNTNADNIAAFGYEINGQQVWNTTKTVTYNLTEGTVNTANCPNNIAPDFGLSGHFAQAKRAFVEVDVQSLGAGVYNITPLIKLTDNSIYAIATWGTVKFVKYGPARINQSIDAFTTSVDGGLNTYNQPADSTSFGGFDASKTIIGVKGWVGYIQSITDFGYYFDGNEAGAIYSAAFNDIFSNTDDQAAILSAGGGFAKRFNIQANMAPLSAGNHSVTYVAKLSGGSVQTIATLSLNEITTGASTDGYVAPSDNSVALQATPSSVQTTTDKFYLNGSCMAESVASNYLTGIDYTVTDKSDAYSTLAFYGWTNTGATNIAAFGYEINGQQVWDDAKVRSYTIAETGTTISSANSVGNIAPDDGLSGDFATAKRHLIEVDLASLSSGVYNITPLIKLTDNSVYALPTWGTVKYIKWGKPTIGLTGASVSLGTDLSINIFANLPAADGYAVCVTMNGETTYIPSTSATLYNASAGQYRFRYRGITPQCMGDAMDIALVPYNTTTGQPTGAPIDTKIGYSVKTNLTNLQATYTDNAHMQRLIADTLCYGASAQTYVGYKTDNLATSGVNITAASTIIPGTADNILSMTTSTANTQFKSANVYFGHGINRLCFVYSGTDSNVTVKINGTVYPATVNGSNHVVLGNDLFATDFDKIYTIELLVNGTVAQTLTYSLNTYAYRTYNSTTSSANSKQLALGLYRYGKSVKNYLASAVTVDGVSYRLNADGQGYSLTSAAGFTGSALSIPSTVNSLPVTAIAANAFKDKTNLVSVSIPSSISTVGELAFYNCTSLSTVTIPASVISVGARCFERCSSLTTINYNNTSAAWNILVAPATGWNNVTGNYTVYCTNNEIIDKNGTAYRQTSVSDDLRIISFNIYVYGDDGATNLRLDGTGASKTIDFATRGGYLKKFVQKYMPDSIGMQEVSQNWLNTFSSSGVFSSFTASDGTAYAYKGVAVDRGDGECNAIYYNSNKYTLVDKGHFWLSDTPDVAGSTAVTYNGTVYTSKYIRICQWVRLRDKTTGYEYVHINTHLDTISNNVRRGQTQVLLAKIIDKFGTDTPMFITGDFNATPLGSPNGVYERRGLHNNMTGTSSFTRNGTKYRSPFADTRLEAAKIVLRNPETNADQTYSGGTWTIDTANGWELYGGVKMPIASTTNKFITSYEKYNPYYGPIDYIFFNRNCFTAKQYKAQIYEKSGNLISDHLPLICDFTYQYTFYQPI